MCSLTPLLLVGFAVGTVVSSLSGNDLAGWVAAAGAVAVLAAVQRLRGTSTTCAVKPPTRTERSAAEGVSARTPER